MDASPTQEAYRKYFQCHRPDSGGLGDTYIGDPQYARYIHDGVCGIGLLRLLKCDMGLSDKGCARRVWHWQLFRHRSGSLDVIYVFQMEPRINLGDE